MLFFCQYHIHWSRVRIHGHTLIGLMMIDRFKPFSTIFVPVNILYHNASPMFKPPTSIFALQILCALVASLISPTASLVTTNTIRQCFNVLTDIYEVFLLLFHCCILLEIKLTTIATAVATTTIYTIEDTGTCTSAQPLVVFRLHIVDTISSSSCLLVEEQILSYLTGLNWFAILHRLVHFGLLLRQMQPGNFHGLLHIQNSSCTAVSGVVVPTSTGLPAAHQH